MKLQYSELTGIVYLVDKKGNKTDVTSDFINMMLLWAHDSHPMLQPNETTKKLINSKGEKVELCWEISLTRWK